MARPRVQFFPIFTSEGELCGAEALLPPREGISPARLLRHDRRVLTAACRQIVAWMEQSPGLELRLWVNVPPGHLMHPRFARVVRGALKHSGLSPELLTLELLETGQVMLSHPQVSLTLAGLFASGIQDIAFDDVGSGHVASVEQLRPYFEGWHKLPWRKLCCIIKLDRGLLAEEHYERIATFLDFAAQHGLTVVVEGIETDAQMDVINRLLEALAELRSRVRVLWQGFLFGPKLLPADFAAKWLNPVPQLA